MIRSAASVTAAPFERECLDVKISYAARAAPPSCPPAGPGETWCPRPGHPANVARVHVVESLTPRRLGPGFRWLLGSVVVSNTGDGIVLAAGPLLIASVTSDPLLVASGF